MANEDKRVLSLRGNMHFMHDAFLFPYTMPSVSYFVLLVWVYDAHSASYAVLLVLCAMLRMCIYAPHPSPRLWTCILTATSFHAPLCRNFFCMGSCCCCCCSDNSDMNAPNLPSEQAFLPPQPLPQYLPPHRVAQPPKEPTKPIPIPKKKQEPAASQPPEPPQSSKSTFICGKPPCAVRANHRKKLMYHPEYQIYRS